MAVWGANRSMGRQQEKPIKSACAVLQRAAGVLAEGGERGRGARVSTRMHRRAGAHPWVAAEGRVRKNRSTCMLIVPQP